ncbi:MAG TPA: hypothetical protein VFK44_14660 [Bacillales bacterium]|nr:hypothetical protein [Bacillales bacterium]
MIVSVYGLFWWNKVLWLSGGVDLNRSIFQYVLPEVALCISFALGTIIFIRGLKKWNDR